MDAHAVFERVREISARFAKERGERQLRRHLAAADFDQLREAGFLLCAVPIDQGGTWQDIQRSTRPVAEMLRVLAQGDPSVALVCSMHPAVLSFWLTTAQAKTPYEDAWAAQRREVFRTAVDGAWWGTITSEPGSGGDVLKTQTIARRDSSGKCRLTGVKHFGSGSGITSFMITSALPEEEAEPDWFYLDVRGAPWDGSTGMKLLAEWDGHGMAATQSHAFSFQGFPATRFAWPGHLRTTIERSSPFVACCFTAAIVGVVDVAVETARQQIGRCRDSLRPYEQVDWTKVEMEAWLIRQAYEGMLRAVESEESPHKSVVSGKTAIAELAEVALGRICRIAGGGTFSRQSPFGFWFEDVRALGFLRPPWGLAFDTLFALSGDEGKRTG